MGATESMRTLVKGPQGRIEPLEKPTLAALEWCKIGSATC